MPRRRGLVRQVRVPLGDRDRVMAVELLHTEGTGRNRLDKQKSLHKKQSLLYGKEVLWLQSPSGTLMTR